MSEPTIRTMFLAELLLLLFVATTTQALVRAPTLSSSMWSLQVHQHHHRRLHVSSWIHPTQQQPTLRTTTRLWYRTSSDHPTEEENLSSHHPNATTSELLTTKSHHDATTASSLVLPLRRNVQRPPDRFARTAAQQVQSDQECVLTIDNVRYNVTAWAKAHPGGERVLHKFHNRNATQAFAAAHHSMQAVALLQQFRVLEHEENNDVLPVDTLLVTTTPSHRWRAKLMTHEDPLGVHKVLGIFCLGHFVFRFAQMLWWDMAAGWGHGCRVGPWLCLVPHALLSTSSLIFATVPRDRVVGKPMIWQEFRAHNIVFGLRSVLTTVLAGLHVRYPPLARQYVAASAGTCFMALIAADRITANLCSNALESTTATMPYWPGCSAVTQKRFKTFYAYSQFMATLACLLTANPAWPFACLFAIQLASLLMTLVRKGLLSARGYHYGYTVALILPYLVVARSIAEYGVVALRDLSGVFGLGATLFYLRRQFHINKYVLWLPVFVARIWYGNRFMPYAIW